MMEWVGLGVLLDGLGGAGLPVPPNPQSKLISLAGVKLSLGQLRALGAGSRRLHVEQLPTVSTYDMSAMRPRQRHGYVQG